MPTVRISTTWRDVEDRRITLPLYFDAADITTIANAQSAFTAYETLLHAISGNAIIGAEVCFGLGVAGTENPDAGYNVRSGAYMSFQNSDDVADGLYIPGILADKIANGIINPSDGDVAALISYITGGAFPLSSRGSAALWTAFNRGFETVRKLSR